MTPPITTLARGRWISAPSPCEKAIGIKPKAATNAVINIARSRDNAVPRTTSAINTPCSLSCSAALTQTKLLSTATPNKAIKPTPAEILNGSPRNHNAKTPPDAATGTAAKTKTVNETELKVRYNNTPIISNTTGVISDSLSEAFWRLSKSPPHRIS